MKVVKKRMIQLLIGLGGFLGVIVIVNVLYIMLNGTSVPAPVIDRKEVTIGSGESLRYLILGDSTTIAQGGEYERGYVVQTANKLAEKYQVTYANYGVSGATINDVLRLQLPEVSKMFEPTLVVIGVGANDVTHFTSLRSIRKDLNEIIDTIRVMNPEAKIVLSGAASMGDVKRFPQPTKWLAGVRTKQINNVFLEVVAEKNATFAYVAEKTGKNFSNNPHYFAADNFHPNDEGYAQWTVVIQEAIDKALKSK